MTISLNQIDELRERTGVNYTDAKEALESCNGDMLEAIVYLERNKKARAARTSHGASGFCSKLNSLIEKGKNTRCVMHKQERIIFSLSMNMLVLIGIITLPLLEFTLIGLIIALLTGYRFKLEGANTSRINEALSKVSDTVEVAKEKFADGLNSNTKGNIE